MIHHLNCGEMRPFPAALINRRGGIFSAATLSCHVLLVEGPRGLALIDAGFGRAEAQNPALVRMRRFLRPHIAPCNAAVSQIRAMGLDPADVSDIVLTHCDVDHAGGLVDFPRARVHLSQAELHSVKADLRSRRPRRYHRHQFAHQPLWRPHDARSERWKGLRASAPIMAAGKEMRLVSLPGHTRGHCGVALRCGDDRWILHVGDATYFDGEIAAVRRRAPIVLRWFSAFAAQRAALAEQTVQALAAMLRDNPDVTAICAHDPEWMREAAAARAPLSRASAHLNKAFAVT